MVRFAIFLLKYTRNVSSVVGMFWNGRGLGTGESNVSIVLLIVRSFAAAYNNKA